MSARNAKKAAAHQNENNLSKAEEMLTKAGFSFVKKGNVLNVTDIPVTIYYDTIGGKFSVLSTKAGTELHENKFIGGVKNFLNELRGDKAPDPETVKANSGKAVTAKTKTVKTSSPKSGVSKTTIALEIFKKITAKKNYNRAEVIAEFISKAGLTKAGASTYYQNFIRKGVK